jgi:hypothetical protein
MGLIPRADPPTLISRKQMTMIHGGYVMDKKAENVAVSSIKEQLNGKGADELKMSLGTAREGSNRPDREKRTVLNRLMLSEDLLIVA